MISEDFQSLLAAASSAPVYPLAVPQNVAWPAVRYARVTTERGDNFDAVEGFVRSTFQVDIYDERLTSALAIAEQIKSAVNNYSGGDIWKIKLDYELETLEEGSKLRRVLQQFIVWHTET